MFNFKNLEALLDVKWKTLFKDAAPKDKEAISVMDKDDYQDILSGTILSMVLHIILIINGMFLSNQGTDIVASRISIINFFPLLFSVFVLTDLFYNYKNSTKTNGMFNYITLLFTFFYTIGVIGLIFPWIKAIYVSPFIGLISVICILGIIVANLFILSGNVGYSEKIYNEYKEIHKDDGIHPDITVERINTGDIADHSFKYCKVCGEKNDINNTTCSRCGNML